MPPLTSLTAAVAAAGGTVLAAAQQTVSDRILWAAGIVTALGVLWKVFAPYAAKMGRLAELADVQASFLQDWNGEPARPGVDARPGLPETVAIIKQDLTRVNEQMHEVRGVFPTMAAGFDELKAMATENSHSIEQVKGEVAQLRNRVSDHSNRNVQQAAVLRQELEDRARTLEAKLDARNADVDAQLSGLAADRVLLEAYRASLHELGIDAQPPELPHPEEPQ